MSKKKELIRAHANTKVLFWFIKVAVAAKSFDYSSIFLSFNFEIKPF
jgi:hypothetical protein